LVYGLKLAKLGLRLAEEEPGIWFWGSLSIPKKYEIHSYVFQQSFRSKALSFRDLSGKFVRSGCTTALDVVSWKTDEESV
nr:hypothetical protein [Tanacetum cinerariifolium]